ncbi:hypothetical protein IX84_28800 [Phaeodactylibacter xiamenensis]|uniref:Uncharacterized protein n=1 Tax=Phaeodactylibacter xiamenensis TaxID=1524460 RepID=A0A098S2S0_9BACT|nr:hypothetical protein IX84_28800 [Phaeodactylibacter xiamenensis]
MYTERKASQKAIQQLQLALPYFSQQDMLQDEAAALLNLAKAHYHFRPFYRDEAIWFTSAGQLPSP